MDADLIEVLSEYTDDEQRSVLTAIRALRRNPAEDSLEMDPQYGEIAERLRLLRLAYGASKTEWCEMNGFNFTQYHNWESGLRRMSLESGEILADRYGLTLDWIYRGRTEGLSQTALKMVWSQQTSTPKA